MRRKRRKWDETFEDDPAAGLLNLFDVWIAFAVALLLASVSYFSLPNSAKSDSPAAASPSMENVNTAREKLERYRVSKENAGGDGERLGTAYRLKSGEVIYVPDAGAGSAAVNSGSK